MNKMKIAICKIKIKKVVKLPLKSKKSIKFCFSD